jgi:serine/threonine protein kinase
MSEIAGTFQKRWKIERELGEGGQAKVYRVREVIKDEESLIDLIAKSVSIATGTVSIGDQREQAKRSLGIALAKFVENRFHTRLGALKVLHSPEKARAPQLAKTRATREIDVMQRWSHPGLLKIIDFDADELWYVSEYHENGTLDHHLANYAGDLPKVVNAIRPLVAAVAHLHQNNIVHRDIKPQNIFIASDGHLVLGDFGLICELDETRVSETHANVGSRDWMPGWAMGMRVDELTPAFDVFALGKVMWSMLSGQPILPLWYYNRNNFNVTELFPNKPRIHLANQLFAECIVEEEGDCLATAERLLSKIDALSKRLAFGESFFDVNRRMCRVCLDGEYAPLDNRGARNFGLSTAGQYAVKLFACNQCRHVEMFYFEDESSPPPKWLQSSSVNN